MPVADRCYLESTDFFLEDTPVEVVLLGESLNALLEFIRVLGRIYDVPQLLKGLVVCGFLFRHSGVPQDSNHTSHGFVFREFNVLAAIVAVAVREFEEFRKFRD